MLNLYRFILWFVFWVAGNFAYLMADSLTQTNDYADAWLLNESISGTNEVEQTTTLFNRLNINVLTRKTMGIDMYGVMYVPGAPLLNATELADLATIAEDCPHIAGKAVHSARALRAMIEGFPRLYQNNCGEDPNNNGTRLAQDEAKAMQGEISVYPNPAKDNVTVAIPFDGIIGLRVLNVEGRLIFTENLSGNTFHTLETAQWSAGVYILQFSAENYAKTSKLVIVK